MESEFREIYDKTIPHSSFLSEKAIFSCMYQAYQMGCDDVIDWLFEMNYLREDVISVKSKLFNSNIKIKPTKNETQ